MTWKQFERIRLGVIQADIGEHVAYVRATASDRTMVWHHGDVVSLYKISQFHYMLFDSIDVCVNITSTKTSKHMK